MLICKQKIVYVVLQQQQTLFMAIYTGQPVLAGTSS